MLQRLGLVSALLHDPQLLILDEPLSGLDPIGRKELKEIIKEIQGMEKTILLTSHILSDIEEICQEVVFLNKGQCLYSGEYSQEQKKLEDLFYQYYEK
jgi:ABC-2 type transport system ATP-binding protein